MATISSTIKWFMSETSSEKRRLPRFHITPCQYLDTGLGKSFAVQDISNGGLSIRLVDRADVAEFSVGRTRAGFVKVEGLKAECEIQVRFVKGAVVGAEWKAPSRELIEHLDSISASESLGENLKAYPLEDVPNTLWLHNPLGIDLLIYSQAPRGEGAREYRRWTLFIHQSFIQWDVDDEIQTGRTAAQDEEGYAHGLVQLETRLIDYDATPDQRLVETARLILKSAIGAGRIQAQEVVRFLERSLE